MNTKGNKLNNNNTMQLKRASYPNPSQIVIAIALSTVDLNRSDLMRIIDVY